MTTQLPADMQARVHAATLSGKLVRFGPILEPAPQAKCPNCNGAALLGVQIENPESRVQTWWDDVTGWVRVDTYAPPCPVCTSQADLIRHLWGNCGLELDERDWRIDYLENRPGKTVALQAARELLAETPAPTGWITLYGDYGRGKSGILKSLVAQFILAGVTARYRRASDVLADIRATFGGDQPGSETSIERDLLAARVLCLDEVERTSDTAWATETLHRILDKRYNSRTRQATVLASNLSPADLPDRLRYLASRMSDGRMVAVGGEDLRGNHA